MQPIISLKLFYPNALAKFNDFSSGLSISKIELNETTIKETVNTPQMQINKCDQLK